MHQNLNQISATGGRCGKSETLVKAREKNETSRADEEIMKTIAHGGGGKMLIAVERRGKI